MNKMALAKINDSRTLEEELNYNLIRGYGTRLSINKVEPLNKNAYRVFFNYNKVFNIVDEKQKRIYVRNIFLKIFIYKIFPPEKVLRYLCVR